MLKLSIKKLDEKSSMSQPDSYQPFFKISAFAEEEFSREDDDVSKDEAAL